MTQSKGKLQKQDLFADPFEGIYEVRTHAPGPTGKLPLDEEILLNSPSGDLFGWTQDAAMGWSPEDLGKTEFLILSTQGGLRAADGTPIALGYHTGHWEVGLLVQTAAETLKALGAIPFAGHVSDPCDGRTQGTPGMMDSLAYRNDAAIVLRRLIRSLPTCKGVLGVASCDKGLPAMMMALAAEKALPGVIVPGGVTLLPDAGEDCGKVQSLGARYAHGEISLEEAAELGCRAGASSGGGCQFMGTAATSQVVAEALGLTVPHAALSPSGKTIWLDVARRSALTLSEMQASGVPLNELLTEHAFHNAMVVHAAVGGSTNLLLHIPAIAHAAGLPRPTVEDWAQVNRMTPRLVDVIPNGPTGYGTVQVYLAGGVPEVMLHLRNLDLLHLEARTVSGLTLEEILVSWEHSDRRRILRQHLVELDGVNPDKVIMSPTEAQANGLTNTLTFLQGNLAPNGAVVKSTAIDPGVIGSNGVYHKMAAVRVFSKETEAVAAVKGVRERKVKPGEILVLIGCGPMGTGMEETYQLTAALRHIQHGNTFALITDARFSGVSTGACIGHVGPEALAGGPLGKLRDGDLVEIVIDTRNLSGRIDFVGREEERYTSDQAARILAERTPHPSLQPHPKLPDDTRLWALLQALSGGTWGGCVYDIEAIEKCLGRIQ
jgi:putative YjhG/YagF family dehydratase